jgi:protein tyrosine phosphatase
VTENPPNIKRYLSYSIRSIESPLSCNDTGSGIYVGETPRANKFYFWSLMNELLVKKQKKSTQKPHLNIISLEADKQSEKDHYRHLLSEMSSRDEEQISKLIESQNFEDTVYWPLNLVSDFGSTSKYSVGLTSIENRGGNLDKYSLKLTRNKNNHVHDISLTHISSWPDGSLPFGGVEYDELIAQEILSLAEESLKDSHLTYIHCRSGLGRAGVFRLALEHARSLVKGESPINISDMIIDYREKYRHAVQTPNQFQYLYRLCELIDSVYEN